MRNFCTECGAQLFATTALADEIVSVYAGSLDQHGNWQPEKEQFCDNKAPWVPGFGLSGGAERHVRNPDTEAP